MDLESQQTFGLVIVKKAQVFPVRRAREAAEWKSAIINFIIPPVLFLHVSRVDHLTQSKAAEVEFFKRFFLFFLSYLIKANNILKGHYVNNANSEY